MKVIWSKAALKDLKDVYDFIAESSEHYAVEIANNIYLRSNQLSNFPYSGPEQHFRKRRRKEYRYLVEGNCKIIYSVEKDTVIIEAVFDTRQSPTKLRL